MKENPDSELLNCVYRRLSADKILAVFIAGSNHVGTTSGSGASGSGPSTPKMLSSSADTPATSRMCSSAGLLMCWAIFSAKSAG